MQYTLKIQKAIIKSAILHKNQTRKDNSLFPFVIHPYSVALILSNYTDKEDIIIAGLLHDVLEDVPDYSEEDMKKEFGKRIYKIVKEVSEDKDPNDKDQDSVTSWQRRKDGYLNNIKNDSFEAMMVCAADKIHNLLSMIEAYKEQGEKMWDIFNAPLDKKIWFYEECLSILKERLDNDIVRELERVYLKSKDLFDNKQV